MGHNFNLMNEQSGVRPFFADASTGSVSFLDEAAFPFPVTQMSGDGN